MSWLGCSCAQTQASHRRPSQRHGDGSTRGRSATLAQTAPREICPSQPDRKSTRLNSSHTVISYAVFCLKKKKKNKKKTKKQIRQTKQYNNNKKYIKQTSKH